jgi:uncharacterized protein YlxW (UPF0749 family)
MSAPGGEGPHGPDGRDGTEPVGHARRGGGHGALSMLLPRANKGQLVVGLLCLVLGFAVVAQMKSTKADTRFASARQDELVGILSDLSQRSERLRGDIRDLEDTKAELARDRQGQAAMDEARKRATTYGLLAGTLPATGPGIQLDITDPSRRVRAGVLLDTLQELRDAGAEVIEVNGVRIGVNSYFLDVPGAGVEADGRRLQPPYHFLAIGDSHTLATALNIPGGVIKSLQSAGATGLITQEQTITVRAVRS